MRYFLSFLLTITLLSSGVIEASSTTGLILLTGAFRRLDPGKVSALASTIALSTITARADNDLGMTATTLV